MSSNKKEAKQTEKPHQWAIGNGKGIGRISKKTERTGERAKKR